MRYRHHVAPVHQPPQPLNLTFHADAPPAVARRITYSNTERMFPAGDAEHFQTGFLPAFALRQNRLHVPLLEAVSRVQVIHDHIIRRAGTPCIPGQLETAPPDVARGEHVAHRAARAVLHKGQYRTFQPRHAQHGLAHFGDQLPDRIGPVDIGVIMPAACLQTLVNGPQRVKIKLPVAQTAAP